MVPQFSGHTGKFVSSGISQVKVSGIPEWSNPYPHFDGNAIPLHCLRSEPSRQAGISAQSELSL
jgi:hypothetical protein